MLALCVLCLELTDDMLKSTESQQMSVNINLCMIFFCIFYYSVYQRNDRIETTKSCFRVLSSIISRNMMTNGESSNSAMYHHYISANLPFMDPPLFTPTTHTMSPVARVFTENLDVELIPETSVGQYLAENGLSYVSLSDEEEMGIFVELNDMKGVIDLFRILRKIKISIPSPNSSNRDALIMIELKGEISFLPPPSSF